MTWKIASSVCLPITFSILWVPMWQPSCPKNLLVEFSGKSYRDNKTFGRFFRVRVFYSTPNFLAFGTLLIRWFRKFWVSLHIGFLAGFCLIRIDLELRCYLCSLLNLRILLHVPESWDTLSFRVVVKRLNLREPKNLSAYRFLVFALCDNLLHAPMTMENCLELSTFASLSKATFAYVFNCFWPLRFT